MAQSRPDPKKRKPLSIRRSLVWSFAQRYTSLLISLPTILILSRLLTPAQIGVYSLAVVFVNLVHMLRDFGTSDYLIQERELDDATARTAFTITLLIAWLLGGAMFLASPWMAAFFREDGLRLVLEVLSINFFLLPFGSITNALLMRDMQYGIRYRIATGQQVAQSALTIALAFYGFGYMSPTWGSVAGMVATVAGCFIWGRGYRIRGVGLTHWRPILGFGVQKTLGSSISRLGQAAPDFVIGRMLGFTEVGLFSRGQGLVRLFRNNVVSAIGAVSYSAYAQRHRDDAKPHGLYLKSMTFLTGIGWPFLAFSALMAFPIMRIMFGDQWDAAVPLMRILAINALIATTASHAGELLTAVGRVGVATRRLAILVPLRVALMVIGASFSLTGVAVALMPMAIIDFVYTTGALVRYTPMRWREVFHAVRPSATVTATTMVLPGLVYYLTPPSPSSLWLPLVYSMIGAGAGWLAGIRLARHPLWFELKTFLLEPLTAAAGRKLRAGRA